MRERVIEAVRARGLEVEVETLADSTRTVEDAARAVGCTPAQIAKSIVFIADGDPVVCVASGAHRVDAALVCEALDCAEARPATPTEVRAATGFGVGGVSPVGHDVPVLFDRALLGYDEVWAAGGDGHTVFSAKPAKLAACARAVVATLGAGDGDDRRAGRE
jgi:prolyl-tRNA editing enzyme YbaK/EbsC (Cys-tRNA(Pro) deacylase)